MFDNMLEILLDNIPYSIWLRSKEGHFIFANKCLCDSLNKTKEEILGKTVYDIYGKRLGKEYTKNYEEVERLGEAKMFSGYQEGIFLECYIAPIKKDGKIESYLGILQDQTERKKYEDEIVKQKNLLKAIMDTIPDSIFYKNLDGEYINCNVSFAQNYYESDKENIIGKKDLDIIKDENFKNQVIKSDEKIIRDRTTQTTNINIKVNGETKYMECIKTPLVDIENKMWGIVGISRDITERKLVEKELRKIGYNDKLTKVYNRAYFDEKIKTLDNERYFPLSLIMGDVDGLKIVNDTLGHLKGDELLVQVSNVLKRVCDEGLIVRWGGDEFIILLPNTESKKAEQICKKITRACKKEPYTSIPLSISLGHSTKRSLKENIDDVIKDAEEKLYKEKLPRNINSKKKILKGLMEILEEKSSDAKNHTDRVVYYAKRLGKRLKLNSDDQKELIISAMLHDIGKIGIQNEIASKNGKLTDEEFNIIKTHVEKGYRVAKSNYEIAYVANNILSHHEKWNGTGYPMGLKGKEIPFLARVICVIDAYDAMTSERSYKKQMTNEQALKEIEHCSGTQFDPKIVKAFIEEFKHEN